MKLNRVSLLLAALLLSIAAASGAGPPVAWSRQFTLLYPSTPSIFMAPDGSVVTVATNQETTVRVFKHSPDGLLQHQYSGDGLGTVSAAAGDGAGSIFVTGRTVAGTGYILKLDSTCAKVWQKTGATPFGIAVSAGGDIYVCGQESGDLLLLKYNAEGDVLWSRRYDGPAHRGDSARALALAPDGGVVVTGVTYEADGNSNFVTIRYSPSGAAAWVRTYDDGYYEGPSAINVDAAGNVTVAGDSSAGTGTRVSAVRYDPSGAEQWAFHFHEPSSISSAYPVYATIHGLAVDSAGRTGMLVWTRIPGNPPSQYELMQSVVAVAPDGTQAWKTRLTSSQLSGGLICLIAAPEGGFFTGGGWDNSRRVTGRLSSTGAVQWFGATENSSSSTGRGSQVAAMTLDGAGNLYTAAGRIDSYAGDTIQIERRPSVLLPVLAQAVTSPATEIAWNSARMNGLVNPRSNYARWHFDYGPDAGYGSSTPEQYIPDGSSQDAPAAAAIAGLPGGSTWHFRLVAVNNTGTAAGEDMTFTTPLSPYQTWAAEKFGSHTAPGSAPAADPDTDGAPNRFEYAFSGDPLAAGPLPGLAVPEWYFDSRSGISYLAIVWQENPAASDIVYIPEGSARLQAWAAPGPAGEKFVIQSLPGNRKRAIGVAFQSYLRLRISDVP